jgi:hypothetical protein
LVLVIIIVNITNKRSLSCLFKRSADVKRLMECPKRFPLLPKTYHRDTYTDTKIELTQPLGVLLLIWAADDESQKHRNNQQQKTKLTERNCHSSVSMIFWV